MRPTEYKQEYCDKLIEHMSTGLSFESFAGTIDICKQTLYTWAEKHPEFMDAKKRGLEKCRVWWESKGRDWLVSTKEGTLNTGVYALNMRNRFGWKNANTPDPEDRPKEQSTNDEIYAQIGKIVSER